MSYMIQTAYIQNVGYCLSFGRCVLDCIYDFIEFSLLRPLTDMICLALTPLMIHICNTCRSDTMVRESFTKTGFLFLPSGAFLCHVS